MTEINLDKSSVRDLNVELQGGSSGDKFSVNNTVGKHALSVGLTTAVNVEINGHVGYYCAGMNQQANIVINGNAGYITTPSPTSNGTYGAHFWLNAEKQFKDVPKNMYFADGYQGQRVYVLPDEELVIVRFGLSGFEENLFLKGVLEAID